MAKGDLSLFVQSLFQEQSKRKLTDKQLADECKEKFPKLQDNDHFELNIKGYRRGYNRGILPLQEKAPKELIGEYLEDGTYVEPGKRGPRAKKDDAKPAAKGKAPAKEVKKASAKAAAKLVLKKHGK